MISVSRASGNFGGRSCGQLNELYANGVGTAASWGGGCVVDSISQKEERQKSAAFRIFISGSQSAGGVLASLRQGVVCCDWRWEWRDRKSFC
jgi:hypothetical protein